MVTDEPPQDPLSVGLAERIPRVFAAVQDQLKECIEDLPQPEPHSHLVFFYFLPKAYFLGRAIGILCENSAATEAKISLRSLTDHYIVFRYILEDVEIRMSEFARFTPIEKMRLLRADRKCDLWERTPEEYADLEAQIQRDYDEVIDEYRTKRGREQSAWHGKTTQQLAASLGKDIEALYELLFRETSTAVHPSNLDSTRYLTDDNGVIRPIMDVADPRRTDRDLHVLGLAAKLNIEFAAKANHRLALAHEHGIVGLDAELMRLLRGADAD